MLRGAPQGRSGPSRLRRTARSATAEPARPASTLRRSAQHRADRASALVFVPAAFLGLAQAHVPAAFDLAVTLLVLPVERALLVGAVDDLVARAVLPRRGFGLVFLHAGRVGTRRREDKRRRSERDSDGPTHLIYLPC